MSTKGIGLAVVGVVLVAIAGFYMMSSSGGAVTAPTTKEFSLRVAQKALAEGPRTLTVRQGDTVVIRITSDEEEELHMHGYDRSVDLTPGIEATLTFVADASGRFVYELEKSKTVLGALEVLP